MTMQKITVLLADDHTLVRQGFRALLEAEPDIAIVGEAETGRQAVQLAKKLRPDVVLMDDAMPLLNGLEATRHFTKNQPQVPVIILSMYADEEHVYQALRAGASGYLLKGAAIEELELAIRSVARGETYLSPPVSKPVIMEYIRRTNIGSGARENLSPRQAEILKLIAEGKPMKQIAFDLAISVKTVETHRMALMTRLGVKDVAGLVRYAVKIGLVDPLS